MVLIHRNSCCYPFNHGLRTLNKAFLHQNPKLLGLSRQFGQINVGAFGVFSNNPSAPILVLWVPCPYFPFYKQLSLYIQIPNINLGLGFGPQRIRDLAIACPLSVSVGIMPLMHEGTVEWSIVLICMWISLHPHFKKIFSTPMDSCRMNFLTRICTYRQKNSMHIKKIVLSYCTR